MDNCIVQKRKLASITRHLGAKTCICHSSERATQTLFCNKPEPQKSLSTVRGGRTGRVAKAILRIPSQRLGEFDSRTCTLTQTAHFTCIGLPARVHDTHLQIDSPPSRSIELSTETLSDNSSPTSSTPPESFPDPSPPQSSTYYVRIHHNLALRLKLTCFSDQPVKLSCTNRL